jgi:small subunit ribosomal protein S21e
MQNDRKEIVDLYIPRKCSWTNRLITAQDRGAVQFRVAHVSKEGYMIKDSYTYISLSGKLRSRGEADMAVNELVKNVPGISI